MCRVFCQTRRARPNSRSAQGAGIGFTLSRFCVSAIGESPSGKASVFGADIRWFESTLPSHNAFMNPEDIRAWVENFRAAAERERLEMRNRPLPPEVAFDCALDLL